MRPPSIVLFERLYLLALAISTVAAVLTWSDGIAAVVADPMIARVQGSERIVSLIYPAYRIAIWAGWLLLLYLVARRGSSVAKWIVTICAALTAFDGARTLLAVLGGPLAGWPVTAAIAEAALVVAAALMLFRRDARPWFGAGRADEAPVA